METNFNIPTDPGIEEWNFIEAKQWFHNNRGEAPRVVEANYSRLYNYAWAWNGGLNINSNPHEEKQIGWIDTTYLD